MTVKGRKIFDGDQQVGEIKGDRPHARDLHKGYRPDFRIQWTSGTLQRLPHFSYLRDVVKFVQSLERL